VPLYEVLEGDLVVLVQKTLQQGTVGKVLAGRGALPAQKKK
jgi:hypothetical protein